MHLKLSVQKNLLGNLIISNWLSCCHGTTTVRCHLCPSPRRSHSSLLLKVEQVLHEQGLLASLCFIPSTHCVLSALAPSAANSSREFTSPTSSVSIHLHLVLYFRFPYCYTQGLPISVYHCPFFSHQDTCVTIPSLLLARQKVSLCT